MTEQLYHRDDEQRIEDPAPGEARLMRAVAERVDGGGRRDREDHDHEEGAGPVDLPRQDEIRQRAGEERG